MKYLMLVLFSAVCVVFSGCAVQQTSDYLESGPLVMYPTGVKQSPDLKNQANRAFLAALDRYRWEIRSINKDTGVIVAEACRRGMHCAEIMATVMGDGSVSIIRTPGQQLTLDEGHMLKQWMNSLQREYRKNMRRAW